MNKLNLGDDFAPPAALLASLRKIVGYNHVLISPKQTRSYRTGFRFGTGQVAAVVRPQSLVEMWRVLNACVAADAIIIMQAANTGLTGGSTPDGDDYDRPVVIVSPMAINRVHLIEEGRQVICLPGSTLYQLETLLRPIGREPHSVIGSSCIGASVMGGVCNNSGGALIKRGRAFTQFALYARINGTGDLELVNHLGITLDGVPEKILESIENGEFSDNQISSEPSLHASDHDYVDRIRDIDAPTPARFNADAGRLYEASGCAGKLAVFAVRLETFAKDEQSQVFYIGTNDPADLTEIRRHILRNFEMLPVAGEYMHRECFDIAERYGKDTYLAIKHLGTDRLPQILKMKAGVDRIAGMFGFALGFSDRWLQRIAQLLPAHLPQRMTDFRDRYEHHLILRMAESGIQEAAAYLDARFPSASGDVFRCNDEEAAAAFLHRFAAAGAAVRYRLVHARDVEDIVALDIALPRNETQWVEKLPDALAADLSHALYYGHFFCYVFHQDYIVRKGRDPLELEHEMCALLDDRHAEYPAEHNVGHLYRAKPVLADFYRSLDPTNSLNPGIGQTSKLRHWGTHIA